jgi:zinc protease
LTAFDRSRPPRPREDGTLRFPPFRRHRLASGLTAFVLEDRRTPLVSLRLLYPWSGACDPPHRPGLAAFTATLLEDGTTSRSSRQIAETIESMGGSLSSGAGWSSAAVSARVLSRDFDPGLDLLADVAANPAFAVVEVERQRRERLADWLRRRDQPAVLAEEAFTAVVYAGTPYGHSLSGDDVSLRDTRREDIVRFWTERRTASGASLLVVGDVDADHALAAAERALGGLGSAPPLPEPAIEPPPARRRVVVVDRPGAAQTELRVGHAGPPRHHRDHAELALGNTLLGGKFTSRINLNLRERHGYTYGAHSAFSPRRGPGPFLVWTAVANQVAAPAVAEILGEIERLRDQPAAAEEVAEGIRYLRGVFPYGLQSQGGALARLEEIASFGLTDDHWDRYLDRLRTIDAARLRGVVAGHLDPEHATIVAVGPADELASGLARFGPVEVRTPVAATE